MSSITDGANGLILQRRGGKSLEQQKRLTDLAVKYAGLTINQLSWLAASSKHWIDNNGYCQPSEAYDVAQAFFGYKRRGSEITYSVDDLSKHPKAKLVYCDALRNPYTDAGGKGVRLVGSVLPSSGDYQKIEAVTATKTCSEVVDSTQAINSLKAMLDD